jgi:hypothetical protein
MECCGGLKSGCTRLGLFSVTQVHALNLQGLQLEGSAIKDRNHVLGRNSAGDAVPRLEAMHWVLIIEIVGIELGHAGYTRSAGFHGARPRLFPRCPSIPDGIAGAPVEL